MKEYNCPDCQRTDSCEGCWRVTFASLYTTYPNGYNKPLPDACVRCNNHPKNGGSGICHCILGGMIQRDTPDISSCEELLDRLNKQFGEMEDSNVH